MLPLPQGRRGRALALALLAMALGLAWLGIGSPALGWFDAREVRLARERTLAARMQEVASALPSLERLAAEPRAARPAVLLAGGSDALAAAALQERLGGLARANGATLVSSETLPARADGPVQRIALRLVLTASYPALVALLQAVATAAPTMLVEELALRTPIGITPGQPVPMEVGMIVSAFRARSATDAPS